MKKKSKLDLLNNTEAVLSWKALMFAYRTTYNILEKNLMKEGCSIPRFQILYFLYFEGSLKPSEIAKKGGVSLPNITTFLKRMTIDDLIHECWDDGGKRPKYKLNKNGVAFFENIFPNHVEQVTLLITPMPKSIYKYLIDLKNRNESM